MQDLQASNVDIEVDEIRVKLEEVQQQTGFLWDNLRVKMQRIMADMLNNILKTSNDVNCANK